MNSGCFFTWSEDSTHFASFCRFHPSICSCFGKLLLELFNLFCAALALLLRILKACICTKCDDISKRINEHSIQMCRNNYKTSVELHPTTSAHIFQKQ